MSNKKRGRRPIDPQEKRVAVVVTAKQKNVAALLPILKRAVAQYERKHNPGRNNP